MTERERESIEREIEHTRDEVGDRIDELDRKLRTTLNFRSFASEHAGQLVAGGAVVGFLAGFGFPKLLRRVLQFGVPLALIAFKVKKSRDGAEPTRTEEV
jgi:hypothetical protein